MARGIVVDGPSGEDSWQVLSSLCAYGHSCGGTSLGFDINVGQGLTNKIYIYDNGVVSVGAPVTPSFDPITSDLLPVTALSDLAGQNVFTPFLSTSDTGLFGDLVPRGPNEFEAVYPVLDGNEGFLQPIAFDIQPLAGGSVGAFTLSFFYGDVALPFPDFSRGVWAYQFGATTDQQTVYGGDIATNFDFGPPPTSGTPEPSTWALLVLGFGGLGSLLRRRRRATLLTSSPA